MVARVSSSDIRQGEVNQFPLVHSRRSELHISQRLWSLDGRMEDLLNQVEISRARGKTLLLHERTDLCAEHTPALNAP